MSFWIGLSLPGETSPKDWDFAAPEAILKAFGGAITNLNNEELSYNKENYEQRGIIIASNDQKTHESKCRQIKEIIKEVPKEIKKAQKSFNNLS